MHLNKKGKQMKEPFIKGLLVGVMMTGLYAVFIIDPYTHFTEKCEKRIQELDKFPTKYNKEESWLV